MRSRSKMLCLAAITAVVAFIGCDNHVTIPPSYLGVAISPRPASIAAGAIVTFTGTVSNNLSVPQWSILDASLASNAGALAAVSGASDQILYTAPPAPPIYPVTAGIIQGTVTLNVTTTSPPGTSIPVTPDTITFVITAPSVTVSLTPLTASVALGSTAQFIGYAVGNINNTLVWQVNGITGGSADVGTINSAGTYTAPQSMPISGNTITITISSQADPTKTQSASIVLH